jgi:hypothetical protein
LFLGCFIYFSYVVGSLKWPTPSDAIIHGQITAQIISENNFLGVSYPSGFHVTASNLGLVLNLYPGETIFLLAAVIMILIPLILYSLTYIHTHSLIFSLLAFISTFFINTSLELQHWLLSSFFMGRYAAIYGYLAVFMFCVLISLTKNDNYKVNLRAVLPYLLVSLMLFLTYPSFSIFVGVFGMYWSVVHAQRLLTTILALSMLVKLIVLMVVFICSLLLLGVFFQTNLLERMMRFMLYSQEEQSLQLNYFYDWRFGFIFFLGIATTLYQIIKKQAGNFSVFYLIIGISVLFSLTDVFFSLVVFTLPFRSMLISTYLAWVVLPILITRILFKNPIEKKNTMLIFGRNKSRKIPLQFVLSIIVSAFLLSQLAPTVLPHLAFMQARGQYADWFVIQKGFASDFEALEWIHRNIPSTDLILNDLSYSSVYLRSFTMHNIGIKYQNVFLNESDVLAYIEVWKHPNDATYLQNIIETYDIKYIFISAESRFFDYIKSKSDAIEYTQKFYKPEEYIDIFNTYSFLTPIFRKGQSVIYKISS